MIGNSAPLDAGYNTRIGLVASLYKYLVVCHLGGCRKQPVPLFKYPGDVDEDVPGSFLLHNLLCLPSGNRQFHMDGLARAGIQVFQCPGADGSIDIYNGPEHIICRQVLEKLLVVYVEREWEPAGGGVDILHLIANLIGVGMPAAVGGNNAVAVERAVTCVVTAEVTAIYKIFPGGIGCIQFQSLVGKVPDKATLVAGILAYQIPVILESAAGVAHHMGIFALDQGARWVLGAIAGAGIYRSIHRAHYIGVALFFSPFVLHGTGRVVALDPVVAGHEVVSVARLVAQAPYDYAWVVYVAIYHTLVTDQVGCLEVRPLGKRSIFVAHSVRLYVAFVNHIEAVLVAQVVPHRVIGVMAGAYGVDVELFHYADVAEHIIF